MKTDIIINCDYILDEPSGIFNDEILKFTIRADKLKKVLKKALSSKLEFSVYYYQTFFNQT